MQAREKDLSKEVCACKSEDILWFNCITDKSDFYVFSLAQSTAVVALVLTKNGGKPMKGRLMHRLPTERQENLGI